MPLFCCPLNSLRAFLFRVCFFVGGVGGLVCFPLLGDKISIFCDFTGPWSFYSPNPFFKCFLFWLFFLLLLILLLLLLFFVFFLLSSYVYCFCYSSSPSSYSFSSYLYYSSYSSYSSSSLLFYFSLSSSLFSLLFLFLSFISQCSFDYCFLVLFCFFFTSCFPKTFLKPSLFQTHLAFIVCLLFCFFLVFASCFCGFDLLAKGCNTMVFLNNSLFSKRSKGGDFQVCLFCFFSFSENIICIVVSEKFLTAKFDKKGHF